MMMISTRFMELDLALALQTPMLDNNNHHQQLESQPALSLQLWSGQPAGDDSVDSPYKRRKLIYDGVEDETNEGGCCSAAVNKVVKYVKVKMEGVSIGRKVDLSLFDSYRALTPALINMFAKYTNGNATDYTILYQDRHGDWMQLVGNVPWEMFVESVQRMEIVVSGDRESVYNQEGKDWCA